MGDRSTTVALTNLGPLPTNFAVNSDCSKDLDDVYKYYTSSEGLFYLLQGPIEQTSCYPSSYTADPKQYYSPARCPTGFTSACESFNSAGTTTETVLRCCPTQSEFVCQTKASADWEQTLGCVVPQTSATTTAWTVSQVSGGRTALATYTGVVGGVNAYQVQVGFQSTDFASSTSKSKTKSKTTKSTKSQTQAGAKTTTTKASSHHSGSSKSKKLTGGATAGIVIGAVVGVMLVVALIWRLVRSRRRRQQVEDEPETQKSDAAEPAPVDDEKDKRDHADKPDTDEVEPKTNTRRPSLP